MKLVGVKNENKKDQVINLIKKIPSPNGGLRRSSDKRAHFLEIHNAQ